MPDPDPSTQNFLINARELGVKRGERWIFRHVNLSVGLGQLVFIIGANGAGKSTCVKTMLGLIQATEGEIEKSSTLVVDYVPQRLTISPNLPLSIRRLITLTKRFSKQEIDTALTTVGLDRLGNPPVTTLSGGEFQRLLLARAMLHRPNLLVLDEPAQGIDAAGTDLVHELIDEVRKDLGCGVLLISHDLERAMDMGDNFAVLIPHEYDEAPATAVVN